jgi:peptide/nickel transport system substrate-binding protein
MVGSFGNERFHPAFGVAAGKDYNIQLHASLISSDRKKQLVPGIATEWRVSSDLLTWTFTIRKGAKFHNGTEITAEDVVWSLQHIIGPKASEYAISPSTQIWAPLMDRIEQQGRDQVSVTLKAVNADFANAVSDVVGGITGAVLPKRATQHNPKEEEAYERNPIGAGIFKMVKHIPADSMQMERFGDHYYQPKNGFPTDRRPQFTTLDLRLVPEEATRVAALRAGEAEIGPISLGSRKQVEAGGGRLVFGPEGVYFHILLMGCFQPQFPCHDKRVRQALNYAIDKKVFQTQLYGGPEVMQVKGWHWVTPSSIGYSPELDPWPYDPKKARQLLAEAGYPGGKGFGKLVIHTYETPNLPLMPESAQLAAEFWRRDLGLDVEVKVGNEGALKQAYFNTQDLYGTVLWRENETKVDGAGSLRFRYANPKGPARAHEDPELFALVKKALAIFDPVEREKTFNSVYRRTRDEANEIPIGYINIPWGVGPSILTWNPYPLAQYPSGLYTITLK